MKHDESAPSSLTLARSANPSGFSTVALVAIGCDRWEA